MYDIISIGGSTVDIFMRSREFRKAHACEAVKSKPLLVVGYDTKVLIEDAHFTTGGGGANAAVSLSRLGLKTAFAGAVGSDEMGSRVLAKLRRERVNTHLIFRSKKYATGMSVALHSYARARTLLLYRGANDHFTPEKVFLNSLKQTKWMYLSHLSGESHGTLQEIATLLKRNPRIRLAWNPGSTQLVCGVAELSKILKRTEILSLNKEEAEGLTGIKVRKGETYAKIAKRLSSYGPRVVAISNGREGAVVWAKGKLFREKLYESGEVVDTTGAGDAFASGLTAGYIHTGRAHTALRWGIVQAGSAVTEYGAQNGLLKKRALEEKLKQI